MNATQTVFSAATDTTADETAAHMAALVNVFAARFRRNARTVDAREAWLRAAESIAAEFDETIALAAAEMCAEAMRNAA